MTTRFPAPRPTSCFPGHDLKNVIDQRRRPQRPSHPAPDPARELKAYAAERANRVKTAIAQDAFERAARAATGRLESAPLQLTPEAARALHAALVRNTLENAVPAAVQNALPQVAEAVAQVPTLHWDGGVQWQPGVEELQRELVAAGYMTEEEVATGPGFYGPRTKAAMARLLADLGLPGDGSVCTPEARAGLRSKVGSTPGAAPGAQVPASPPAPSAPVQAGQVPAMDQNAPAGANNSNYWNGASNCGPTSAAMVARALGLGGDKSDAELIMQMYRAGGTTEKGSSPEQVATMLRSLGLSAHVVEDPGLAELDAALASGKPVIINGDYFATGVPGRDGSQESGHFCVVEGRDANGNYIIVDPAGGQRLTFTPQAMTNFFREHTYQGALVVLS